jgi:L-asparaginase II
MYHGRSMLLRDKQSGARGAGPYPENPVLLRRWRGDWAESQHRGAWALVDSAGDVIDGGGDFRAPVFARSSTKSLQAIPLFESGAAKRFGLSAEDVALACSSHNAEDRHTRPILELLDRLDLNVGHLLCGSQAPGDPAARRELFARGESPLALHHNCSGKHAGFLALAKHLDVAPEEYLLPESDSQMQVRRAVLEMCDLEAGEWGLAIDGCSAPTFRLPLHKLALGLARVADPQNLGATRAAACTRMTDAVAAHPTLVAGTHKRLCTDLARVTRGRLFPKLGAEAVYVIGVRGADRGLALKIDDGNFAAMNRVVIALLDKLGLISKNELQELGSWADDTLHNAAGLDVGRTEVSLS